MKINNSSPVVKAIPNLITLINLTLGFVSIKLIFQGLFYQAVLLIITGMVLDYLDGKLARRLNVVSELGKHLDSLSDLVSFGIAPAVLCWTVLPLPPYLSGAIVVVFLWCGTYRLARFNTLEASSGCFRGFPITAAGALLAIGCLYHDLLPLPVLWLTIVILALSMVAGIPFYSFKSLNNPALQPFLTVLLVVVFGVSFFLPWVMAVVLGSYYVSGVILYVVKTIIYHYFPLISFLSRLFRYS